MNAHIISIGTEILIGQTIDTNSVWLASELTKMGFSVDTISVIPDTAKAITTTLKHSLNNADVVITTGGLGPTNDDITKKTLAELFDSPVSFSETVFKDVVSFLEQRGAKMNDLNRLQATFPDKAEILPNKQGTAAGMLFKQNNKVLISLPGVPSEMKAIMQQYGLNALKRNFKMPFNYYHTTLITGIGESQLAERIAEWEANLPEHIKIAYLPSPGLIKLRLGLKGANESQIQSLVKNEVNKLHKLIPELIFSSESDSIEEAISSLLKQYKLKVSSAESCTGGNIAKLFTSVSGCSDWYNGSVVAYSNKAKAKLLKIPLSIIELHGAVSEEVVTLMSKNAKKRFKTDYCVSTSGIAGPSGGTEKKPVGTIWISVAGPNRIVAKKFTFGKERFVNIKRSTIAALNMLREQILIDNA